MKPLPPNSNLRVEQQLGRVHIQLPHCPRPVRSRFWAVGSTVGLFGLAVVSADFAAAQHSLLAVVWAAVALFSLFPLYRSLRPTAFSTAWEQWFVDDDGLYLDFSALSASEGGEEEARPQQLHLGRPELSGLHLHQRPSGNQLLLSYNNQQLELAQGATNWDREWLFHFLQSCYQLDNEQ